jgi:DNA-binding GntR family transcriptional regulator
VAQLLAEEIRGRILDGELPAGAPLREVELAERYDVSRHTLRAALRLLAADGLAVVEPNRGARVAALDRAGVTGLFELRTALEVEAARLALERHGGRLPAEVHRAAERLASACRRDRSWRVISELHDDVHRSLVDAAGSARISAAYAALAAELRLFVLQIRPAWPLERMAVHHLDLVAALEREGADALRPHLADGLASIVAGLDS